jgi:glycosyltransferase involved in cell wall biosynthesis
MLNDCDIVHTVSTSSARRLTDAGVCPSLISNISLSVNDLTAIVPKPDYIPSYPIVFGYRGALHVQKGIGTLMSAFSRLDPGKYKLIIYGSGDKNLIASRIRPGGSISYRGQYKTKDINQVLREIDVGIVPSICEETFGIVGLEYNNARIPTIGSDLGGITEWLKDQVNGLRFRAGDELDLLRTIQRLGNDPSLITSLQRNIKPWKNAQEYAFEISGIYKQLSS